MSKSISEHVAEARLQMEHDDRIKKRTTEGGACLTGHNGRYAKVTCSYRWQAHEQAKALTDDEKRATYHAYLDKNCTKRVKTMSFETRKRKVHPKWYVASLRPPKGEDWSLTGPAQSIRRRMNETNEDGNNVYRTVPPSMNFTQASWPYWHNAHHLIPKSIFNESIDATAKTDARCPLLIRSLLIYSQPSYNINHKINMIILPQDEEVGEILNLPRHLVLKEKYRTEIRSHLAYSDYVGTRLTSVWANFKLTLKDSAHPDEELGGDAIDSLEGLSEEMRRNILSFGSLHGGKPLIDMEFA